jgi:hypothetical protein
MNNYETKHAAEIRDEIIARLESPVTGTDLESLDAMKRYGDYPFDVTAARQPQGTS